MKYNDVFIDAFGYELPPNVITSDDLEKRLEPVISGAAAEQRQLEAITGIQERRFWDRGFRMSTGAIMAGRKALAASAVKPQDIGMLIYGGVCRDHLEPATACAVADGLDIGPQTEIYDVSNACLGVLNGIVQLANAIELGQIQTGMVVSCESARQIVEQTIDRLAKTRDMGVFKKSLATLTGGSGAVAVVLTHRRLADRGHHLQGGVACSNTRYHRLCIWGPDTGIPATMPLVMETDSVAVLENGVALGKQTYRHFRQTIWNDPEQPDKIICHQVGSTHQRTILDALKIPVEKDFTTYRYLGNIGTVSLPITAAIAAERGFLKTGDKVGLFGIGSGLNCLLLGVRW